MRERSDSCLGGHPLFALDCPGRCGAVSLTLIGERGLRAHFGTPSRYRRYTNPAVVEIETTLSQEWSRNSIRGPQCAFEMSMFKCPAVHKLTRN